MSRKAMAALVLAAAAFVVPGCVFHKVQVNDPQLAVKAKTVVPGVTRESELKGILGVEPTSFITLKDGGRLLTYAYGLSKTGGLNLIIFSTQKTNSGLDTAFIMVRADGVVQKTWIGDHSQDITWDWWAFGE